MKKKPSFHGIALKIMKRLYSFVTNEKRFDSSIRNLTCIRQNEIKNAEETDHHH